MSLPERVHNEPGGYFFLPSIRAFSGGVAADGEHEIVRVRARRPVLELPQLVHEVVEGRHGRPPAALCSVELRSGRPVSWAEFDSFNARYAAVLDEMGVTRNGVNPVARTNVVPVSDPPAGQVIHAFSFTVPRSAGRRPTFVVAGAAEVAGNSPDGIVRPGDVSAEALADKADFVLERMIERMAALGVERDELTSAHLYTAHPVDARLCRAIGRGVGDVEGSFRLHVARPPIKGLEVEMDLRSVAYEVIA
jgi:hypothetical protein